MIINLRYITSTLNIIFFTGLRNIHGICPPEVVRFLLDLFKYNDNSKNHYSDNYYKAALVDALAATITPVISVLQPVSIRIILFVVYYLDDVLVYSSTFHLTEDLIEKKEYYYLLYDYG